MAHLNPQMWSELMIDDADALAFEIDHPDSRLAPTAVRQRRSTATSAIENLLAEGDRIKRALDDETSH